MQAAFRVLILPILLLAGSPFVPAEDARMRTILAGIQRAEAVREAAISDMAYMAETRVVEWVDEARKEIKKETHSLRKVYVLGGDQIHNEYLTMTVDGRRLSSKQMQRELAKQRRGGEGGFSSPYNPETAPLYNFELKGLKRYEGREVWIVAFEPKQAADDLYSGTAYVSTQDYQTQYLEISPAKLPGVLKQFAMSIRFAPVDGFWLPEVFSMDMHVRIDFLLTLSDRTLSIVDRYSQYRLNVGVDPELFDND